MNTDILIPLGTGSRHNNLELRFCLRSIEEHLKGVGNIFIVGELPDFLKHIIYVPCAESSNNWQRANNIYRKILAGINFRDLVEEVFLAGQRTTIRDIQLSDNFLFMNDDHYLLQDYEAGNFPYYHRGLIDVSPYITNNSQVKQMVNTIALFDSPVLDFDVHCPIVYNKYSFKDCFFNGAWPEHGYGIKSTYCKKYSINGEQMEDLKFRERVFFKESIYKALENRPWFSIGDKVLMEGSKMIEVLNELYPNKSNYEL